MITVVGPNSFGQRPVTHCAGGVILCSRISPQRACYDRAARKNEDVRQIARYIVANQLRAGLVRNIGDFPHWDCIRMTDDDETPLVE